MKKIAIVTSGYMPVPASLGGAVECLDDYLINENEIKNECNIEVFSCYESNSEKMSQKLKNTKVNYVKTPTIIKLADFLIYNFVKLIKPHVQTMSYRYILKRLHFIKKVARKLHDEEFDEVILENHATLLLVMKKYRNYEKYKGRFIYHLHNEQSKFYGCESVLKNVKVVASVSEYISDCIKKKIPNLKDSQVTIWKNCVDSTRFGSEAAKTKSQLLKKRYGIDSTDKIVLFSGRLSPEKGIKELLEAFVSVKNSGVKLVIAGGYFSGDRSIENIFESELKSLAKKLGDKIIFTGFVNYRDMPAIYSMADIAVIPSIWNDPAPLTVIEAITSGVPLITTNSGGIVEYANEECAIIVMRDENFKVSLAKAINKLIQDDELRNRMSRKAIEISSDWTISNYYKRFIELVNM